MVRVRSMHGNQLTRKERWRGPFLGAYLSAVTTWSVTHTPAVNDAEDLMTRVASRSDRWHHSIRHYIMDRGWSCAMLGRHDLGWIPPDALVLAVC